MSASSPFMSHAQPPQSGYRLRPVRMDASVHPPSVSPSPPPSSAYSADVPTPNSAHMFPPHPMQTQSQDPHTLPPLVLSPSNPNAPPRPWSPSAGVREIDAAPPPRRAGLPAPPTGHDLMALFPAPSPSAPPTYAAVPNAASGSGAPSPGANVPIPIPTSGWFINEERRFFAREGKEIVRLKREEVLGVGSSGSNGAGSGSGTGTNSIGTKREREGDREREMASTKRSPPANHPGPSTMAPGPAFTSFHSSPPPPPAPPHHSSHSRSHSASQPQQPFLTLVQSNTPFRQPPPPPPRDRDPARDRERGRDAEGDMYMQSTAAPPMNALSQHQQGRGPYVPPPSAPQHSSVHSSPAPPQSSQQVQHHAHGHVRAPSYGAPPQPQQYPQQYTFSHTPPPAPHPHSQPPPPHTRGSYTHPPPPPPAPSRGSPSYSVQPPSHHEPVTPPAAPQAQSQALHPTYSAVPPPPAQHPPYTHHHQQNYSVSPPSQPQSAHPPDAYVHDRERGREAYPSPSPSREGGGSAYLAASERRRAGKHTRRVVVKA
ncbi:hypothetical protein ACEPAI_2292 [Sanghuangporus weigelae]